MSVTLSVFLRGSRMLSPTDWAEAIKASEFDMELATDFDVRFFSGFLPCKYAGRDAGFEYSSEIVADHELDENVIAQIGDRDVVVNFNTHSDMRGLITSIIASAVLCARVDGVLWDAEANELVSDALSWGKEMEANIKNEL